MHAKAQPRMQVIRKEEKEAKLREFIQTELETLASSGVETGQPEFLLIARSTDSPVVRAIAGLGAEIAACGCRLKAVLIQTDPGLGKAVVTADLAPLDVTVRCATNARLVDAHEQLVLSRDRVWIGDCMRRDPSKRDAFEFFTTQGGSMASWAHKSFVRFWDHSEPIELQAPAPGLLEDAALENAIAPPASSGAEFAGASVLTRH